MIIVLAYRTDARARQFVDSYPGHRARLLTSRDLSREGWQLCASSFAEGAICADGEVLPVRHIHGLISLLPVIPAEELLQIEAADRPYVAAEMNAFLTYFLHRLDCPKLNPPALGSFLGCNWRPEQWLTAAAASGFDVRPVCRSTTRKEDYSSESVAGELKVLTLVGDKLIGKTSNSLLRRARQLRRRAGTTYLQILYRETGGKPEFVTASVLPNLSDPAISEAILEYL